MRPVLAVKRDSVFTADIRAGRPLQGPSPGFDAEHRLIAELYQLDLTHDIGPGGGVRGRCQPSVGGGPCSCPRRRVGPPAAFTPPCRSDLRAGSRVAVNIMCNPETDPLAPVLGVRRVGRPGGHGAADPVFVAARKARPTARATTGPVSESSTTERGMSCRGCWASVKGWVEATPGGGDGQELRPPLRRREWCCSCSGRAWSLSNCVPGGLRRSERECPLGPCRWRRSDAASENAC